LVATESRVIRLFKFRPVRAAFDLILRDKMVPALLQLPGLSELYVGRQGPEELGPRLIGTVWESRESMASAVGESLDHPIFLPEYLHETTDRELEFFPLAFGYRFDRLEPPGVLRLVNGQVQAGGLDRYVDQARAGTLADADQGKGPMALYLAPRAADRFVTLSVWSDWASLQEATGGEVNRPIATRHAQLLEAWQAEHYEAIPGLGEPARAINAEAAPA
jgi:hypothetical protein